MDGEYEEHIQILDNTHHKQLNELESSFQHKMQIEVGRHAKLSTQREKEQAMWEHTMKELVEAHARKMEEDAKSFDAMQVDD